MHSRQLTCLKTFQETLLIMFARLLTVSFALGAWGVPYPAQPACRELQIPISISVPRFIVNATVNDDWDAASLTLNLTRRDSTMPSDPLPIAGSTSSAVESTYMIGATVCGTGGPTLILTHGIIESKLYWHPTFEGAEMYSFIDAAVAAGYSVVSYDRIGVGSSSKVSALNDAQFQVETAVLNSLIDYARDTIHATHVGLIGHSYGSYISAASASQKNVDSLVLTGFGGNFSYFAPFIAGAGFRVARIQNPERWGSLDSEYLTSSDLYAETFVYYAEPHFEHRVAEWSYNVGSEPFSVAELPSLLSTPIEYGNITAPVMVIQGQFDVSACGGNCLGLLDQTKSLFTGSKVIETVDNLPAGHNLNLHKIAPQAFQMILEFLATNGV
ncbi:alpha/beta-hydrolase [Xylariaceae sp. FL1651]|nr:alpha/beta-hydrolase [Xylariaceae sp. FL1651]